MLLTVAGVCEAAPSGPDLNKWLVFEMSESRQTAGTQPAVTRLSRRAASQARLSSPGPQQEPRPTGLTVFDEGNVSDVSRDSTQNRQPATPSLVKEYNQARPNVKSSPRSRGGLASVARLAVFNIDYFSDHPEAFFSLAKELYPGSHLPNYIHYFIRTLHHKGLLLRVYTQNIDGLEKMCGIPDDKLVEAHGNFATASCHLCYTPYPAEDAKVAIMSGNVPTCSFCAGTVKPDVVFFGEDLPQKYFLHSEDFPKADLLIIMGTSLQIEPFASLVNTVRSSVPRLLLNRDAVGPFVRTPLRRADHVELGNLVDSVQRFAEILGWSAEIEDLMRSQGSRCFSPSVPEALRRAGCSSEENDSETECKSSVSSSPSN
ncbi:hypothetical protein CRUP_001938 [Coryphaenoides rupestris]|nr:hypothetical protein CRUP_001938 [Coryphaenoides rupestris]